MEITANELIQLLKPNSLAQYIVLVCAFVILILAIPLGKFLFSHLSTLRKRDEQTIRTDNGNDDRLASCESSIDAIRLELGSVRSRLDELSAEQKLHSASAEDVAYIKSKVDIVIEKVAGMASIVEIYKERLVDGK